MHDKLTTCGLDYLVFNVTNACKDYHTFYDSSLSRPLREWKHLFPAISEVIRTFSFHSELFRIDLILLKFKTKENKFLILY